MKIFSAKALCIRFYSDIIFKFSKYYDLEQKHIVNGILTVADEVIKEKEKLCLSENNEDEPQTNKPQIFIDQLYRSRRYLSDNDIRDEINTLIPTVNSIF